MKVTEIIATAGRTFNHPYESFSNFRPSITIKATITDDDDLRESMDELRLMAEAEVERAKKMLLGKAKEKYDNQFEANTDNYAEGEEPF